MRHLPVAVVAPENFQALLVLCAGDPSFPRTYGAWQALVRQTLTEASNFGRPTLERSVEPGAFDAWCMVNGIEPGLFALRRYLELTTDD